MVNTKESQSSIYVRLSLADKQFLQAYATSKRVKLGKLLRDAALDQAEDEYDRQAYDKAIIEFRMDSNTFSATEIAKEFGVEDGGK